MLWQRDLPPSAGGSAPAPRFTKWLSGLWIENLGMGTRFVLAASIIHAELGRYLVRAREARTIG